MQRFGTVYPREMAKGGSTVLVAGTPAGVQPCYFSAVADRLQSFWARRRRRKKAVTADVQGGILILAVGTRTYYCRRCIP
jgi:hypothetical protein